MVNSQDIEQASQLSEYVFNEFQEMLENFGHMLVEYASLEPRPSLHLRKKSFRECGEGLGSRLRVCIFNAV